MTTEGEWESVGVAVQNTKDRVFYHVDVICNDTIRVARSSGVGKELALGNARLIAAAPALLAACEKLVKFADEVLPQAGKLCFDIGNLNNALVLARPAIAEARL